MKQKIQCPTCCTVFEIEMEYGKEVHDCPSCGAELDVTAVFNDLGEALSITTATREKAPEQSENIGRFNAIDASGVKEIARMQEYITNLENCFWSLAMTIDGKDNAKTVIKFTEKDSWTEWAVEKVYKFIKEHRENKEENDERED